jgi:hypothetical protein
MFTIIIFHKLYTETMNEVGAKIEELTSAIDSSVLKLIQFEAVMFLFNSFQASDYTSSLFILLFLKDDSIHGLCHRLIESKKKCVEAGDASIFYTTGHVHPGAVASPPITIQMLPGATDEEVLYAFKNEKRRLIINARKEGRACYDRQTLLEKELGDKVLGFKEQGVVSKT